ncbi:MAG: hypothetical protein ACE5K0_07065 [Candidatus Methanofastidiosia archaeon]
MRKVSFLVLVVGLVLGMIPIKEITGNNEQKLLIEDFESVDDWENLILNSTYVKEGKHSGKWEDMVERTYIKKYDISHDWSEFDYLEFWIYSKNATGTGIALTLYSENDKTEKWDYFWYDFFIDWKGWKHFELSKSDFKIVREPVGWNKIDNISFYAKGWDHVPDPSTILYFDDMYLFRDLIKIESFAQSKTGLAGSKVIHRVKIQNKMDNNETFLINLDTKSLRNFNAKVSENSIF